MSLLSLKDVNLTFPSIKRLVLQNISYEIEPGDFVILLGSNGSGKSTLLKLLHRDLTHFSGDIKFQGQNINKLSLAQFSQDVAVFSQNSNDSMFTSLTLFENYLLTKRFHCLAGIAKEQERIFLKNYLLNFNPMLARQLDCLIGELSGGEKQAFGLALCLMQSPKLLLLDEHTSALDPRSSANLMRLTQEMIVKQRITCILTTHDLDIALHYGSRILMLHQGKIHKIYNVTEKAQLTKELLVRDYLV